MLSTKDLKYQMVRRRTEKLTERFVGPYKIKKIVSLNTVELELPSTIKIHPVVNISVTVVLWTSSYILYGLLLYQKGNISKATC